MERNHICKKCGGIAGWDSYFQSWICTRCGNEEPKPITNYDRIISKSPEEMAEWLCDIAGWLPEYEGRMHPILEWLKQEATDAK